MTVAGRSILQEMFPLLFQAVVGVLVAMVGLTSTTCFFAHLLALGKAKYHRLRDSGRRKLYAEAARKDNYARDGYGSTACAPTHWSVYTTEGNFTGSCNTEYVHVDEDEFDDLILKR